MRSTKKKIQQRNGMENDARGKLAETSSEQRPSPRTRKGHLWAAGGKSVTTEGVSGQAGFDLGRLRGRKASGRHWNVMEEGGAGGGVQRPPGSTADTAGVDLRSFWPRGPCAEPLCYPQLCRKSQRALIETAKAILSENSEKTT